MNCFDEKKLYEFIDNALDRKNREKIENHLRECKICQEKVHELIAFDKDLKLFWTEFRKKCPSPETMYEYSLGELSKEEAEKISEHLDFCEICKMKYEESEEMAKELEKIAASEEEVEPVKVSLSEDKKRILEKLADSLDLSKKSKEIMESVKKFWKSHFSYEKPISLKVLEPGFGRAFEWADIGKGFEKEVIQEEKSPFQVEVNQFGKQLNIILHTEAELFKNSIVKFQLSERDQAKFSGVIFVSEGTGKYMIDLVGEDIKRPEKEPYKIKLDAISYVDLLADIKDPKSSKILDELMKSDDAEIRKSISEILGKKKDSGSRN